MLQYQNYPKNVRAAHFAFIPFTPPTMDQIVAANVTLDAFGQEAYKYGADWNANGSAYLLEQTHKVCNAECETIRHLLTMTYTFSTAEHHWASPP
jgi:hypothetical protein